MELLILHVEPLLLKYRVNLGFYGHNHVVQRQSAVFNKKVIQKSKEVHTDKGIVHTFVNPQATVHMVIGTAGAGFTENAKIPKPEWNEMFFYKWGYARVTVYSSTELYWEWVEASSGTVFDRMSITQVTDFKEMPHWNVTSQNNNTDDFILANTLFGDGAAAVIISSNAPKKDAIKIKSFNSLIIHKGKNDMAWQLSETGFIMNLTSYVSELINGSIKEFLNSISLKKESIDYWAIHPGGKKILDDFSDALDIDKSLLHQSYEVLKNYGNMSSPTILFVLKQVIENNSNAKSGETIFTAAFGPGLSIETMQLEYV